MRLALVLAGWLIACAAAVAEAPMRTEHSDPLAAGECEWELFAERLRFGAERGRGLSSNAGCGLGHDIDLGLGIGQWRSDGARRERALELYGRWRLRDGGDDAASLALVYGAEALKRDGESLRHASSTLLLALDQPLAAAWLARFNVGLSRSRSDSDSHSPGATARLWALGLEWQLAESLTLVGETFGQRHGRPTQGLGLRWQPAPGWSFGLMRSATSIGRGQPSERALLLSAQWLY